MAFRDDERGSDTLAFDERIGRQGGPMNNQIDVVGFRSSGFQDAGHTQHETIGRRVIGGENFTRCLPAVFFENHVGKSTANIDGESRKSVGHRSPLCCLSFFAAHKAQLLGEPQSLDGSSMKTERHKWKSIVSNQTGMIWLIYRNAKCLFHKKIPAGVHRPARLENSSVTFSTFLLSLPMSALGI